MSASWLTLEFQTTQRCHSVFSCLSPAGPFQLRLVASENVATRLPPDVERTSGSAPRFPINVTLFKLRLTVPPGRWRDHSRTTLYTGSDPVASKRSHGTSNHRGARGAGRSSLST